MAAKILYISTRPPFPKSGGREHMIAQSLQFLTTSYDVHVICFHGRKETVDMNSILELGVSNVETIEIASSLRFIKNLISRFDYSLQENLYYSPLIEEKLRDILFKTNPSVVICDMLRTSQFFYGVDYPLIVDLDDILSNRYKKMLSGSSDFSTLGSFSRRLPRLLSWVELLVRGIAIKHEYVRIKKSEVRAVENADSIILTSPLEAKAINRLYNTSKSIGISQCVGIQDHALPAGENLLFIGNMTTAQNLASLKDIVTKILPAIHMSDISLIVVGTFDARAEKIVATHDNVKLVGFVSDLDTILIDCKIALMPVSFGTGVKTKILDAMAMKLPIVTNSVGAEGLSIDNEVHGLIADDYQTLASNVNRLIASDKLCRFLAGNAEDYVRDLHSYEKLQLKYNNIVEHLIVNKTHAS